MNILFSAILFILWLLIYISLIVPLITAPIQPVTFALVTLIIFYLSYNVAYNAGINKNSK